MVHILDENKIKENYEKFRKLINQTFTGERLEKLNKMYDELEDRIILTPHHQQNISTTHSLVDILTIFLELHITPLRFMIYIKS